MEEEKTTSLCYSPTTSTSTDDRYRRRPRSGRALEVYMDGGFQQELAEGLKAYDDDERLDP